MPDPEVGFYVEIDILEQNVKRLLIDLEAIVSCIPDKGGSYSADFLEWMIRQKKNFQKHIESAHTKPQGKGSNG